MKKASLHSRLSYALALVRGRSGVQPRAGVVLGSGLSAFADRLHNATVIPYDDIPEFPVSRVPGHPGRLIIGDLPTESGDIPVAALQGRVHSYEGWSADDVAFGARVVCGLGVKTLVVTNAAGGVNPEFEPGALVRITDHINLSGVNPLAGENDDRVGPRFVDLTYAYDAALGAQLEACASWLDIPLRQGVYACMAGPSYETPAEIRMLRALGADLVGMSTIPEVIAARHMGVRVTGVSLVTNRAAGLQGTPLSHGEVQAIAAREGERLAALLAAFLPYAAGQERALARKTDPDVRASLLRAARAARRRAYAPYSEFKVGAAVHAGGQIHSGCNLENASYGLTVCAERNAIGAAVLAGGRRVEALAVASGTSPPTPPCGACLQVLAEFAGADTPVFLAGDRGAVVATTLGDLLPHAFGRGYL